MQQWTYFFGIACKIMHFDYFSNHPFAPLGYGEWLVTSIQWLPVTGPDYFDEFVLYFCESPFSVFFLLFPDIKKLE